MPQNAMRQLHDEPNLLRSLVASKRVRWDVVERRLHAHPEEARCLDRFGNSVLLDALRQTAENQPPPSVVRLLIRIFPESVWIGITDGRSPLHAACQRRASYELLLLLTDERPSVRQDIDALFAFWKSYSCLFGGDEELVRFCKEAQDREAYRIMIRLYHLLAYCTSRENQCKPFHGLHTLAESSNDLLLFQTLVSLLPDQAQEADCSGNFPLHVLARTRGSGDCWTSRNARLRTLLAAFPHAIRLKDSNGNLPIHIALEAGWNNLDEFLAVYPESVAIVSGSGMYPIEMAVTSAPSSHALDLVYQLLRRYPQVLQHRLFQCTCSSSQDKLNESSAKETSGSYEVSHEFLQVVSSIAAFRDEHIWKSFHAMLSFTRSRPSWFITNAASSLPFCPPGLLQLFLCQSTSNVDDAGWTPLHHVAAVGSAESQALCSHDSIDDRSHEEEELPCVQRLRLILSVSPELAQVPDRRGRLPLHIAAMKALPLTGLKLLYSVWPDSLLHPEATHHLPPALLAATSNRIPLDTLYQLLLAGPQVLRPHRSTDIG